MWGVAGLQRIYAQSEFRVCASSEGKSVKKSNRGHKTSRDLERAEGSVGASRLDVDVGRVSIGSSGSSCSNGVDGHASHGGRRLSGKHRRAAGAVSNGELARLSKDAAGVTGRAGAHEVDLVVFAEREVAAGRLELEGVEASVDCSC